MQYKSEEFSNKLITINENENEKKNENENENERSEELTVLDDENLVGNYDVSFVSSNKNSKQKGVFTCIYIHIYTYVHIHI
jgi:hypothetical protein